MEYPYKSTPEIKNADFRTVYTQDFSVMPRSVARSADQPRFSVDHRKVNLEGLVRRKGAHQLNRISKNQIG